MSLADARRHWRFLVAIPAMLLAVAVVGPLILYATWRVLALYGTTGIVLVGLFYAIFLLVGIFSIAWLTGRRTGRSAVPAVDDRGRGADG